MAQYFQSEEEKLIVVIQFQHCAPFLRETHQGTTEMEDWPGPVGIDLELKDTQRP